MTTTTTRAPLRVAYSDDMLRWQLGDGHPTNPMRAKLAVDLLRSVLPEDAVAVGAPTVWHGSGWRDRIRLTDLHTREYLDELWAGRNGEWAGVQPELGDVATLMAASTLWLSSLAQRDLDQGDAPRVGFNPQGAKHHAMSDRGSGFCVLNDMAMVAHEWSQRGKRVLYLDWDVHRGDGVEALTWDDDRIMTASVQGAGMFPGGGNTTPSHHVHNHALPAGSGDHQLRAWATDKLRQAHAFKPDLVLVAAGADGLATDPLGNLAYSIEGLAEAGAMVGRWAGERGLPVIVGGAGGYQPLGDTPVAWAAVVSSLWNAHCQALEHAALV